MPRSGWQAAPADIRAAAHVSNLADGVDASRDRQPAAGGILASAGSPTGCGHRRPARRPAEHVLTLSCDHRALDGARGARFLGALAELIEGRGAARCMGRIASTVRTAARVVGARSHLTCCSWLRRASSALRTSVATGVRALRLGTAIVPDSQLRRLAASQWSRPRHVAGCGPRAHLGVELAADRSKWSSSEVGARSASTGRSASSPRCGSGIRSAAASRPISSVVSASASTRSMTGRRRGEPCRAAPTTGGGCPCMPTTRQWWAHLAAASSTR